MRGDRRRAAAAELVHLDEVAGAFTIRTPFASGAGRSPRPLPDHGHISLAVRQGEPKVVQGCADLIGTRETEPLNSQQLGQRECRDLRDPGDARP